MINLKERYKTLNDLERKTRVLTKLLPVDYVTTGGISCGRMIEIYGKESSGKTAIAFWISGRFLEEFPDKNVLYIDTEVEIDDEHWVRINGIGNNGDRFHLIHESDLGQVMDIILTAIQENNYSLIVFDSVAATGISNEMKIQRKANGEVDTTIQVGAMSQVLTPFVRKIKSKLWEKNITLVILNHMRAKISTGYTRELGDSVPGGSILRYMSGGIFRVKRLGDSNNPAGIGEKSREERYITHVPIRMKAIKNKINGIDGREFDLYIDKENGIDAALSSIEFLKAFRKSFERFFEVGGGGNYRIFDEKIRGAANLLQYFKDNNIVDRLYETKEILNIIYGKELPERTDEYDIVEV